MPYFALRNFSIDSRPFHPGDRVTDCDFIPMLASHLLDSGRVELRASPTLPPAPLAKLVRRSRLASSRSLRPQKRAHRTRSARPDQSTAHTRAQRQPAPTPSRLKESRQIKVPTCPRARAALCVVFLYPTWLCVRLLNPRLLPAEILADAPGSGCR